VASHDAPLRSDRRSAEAPDGVDRDTRIEHLLLVGLDAYFAGQYEQAINLWTRVLFLDRHHDRARAYVERARSAQAELQRESEAVLQQGLDAFQLGDVARARRLISDAIDRGASPDEAQGVLDRIDRLGVGRLAPTRAGRSITTFDHVPTPTHVVVVRPRRVMGWTAALLLAAAAAGLFSVGAWGLIRPDVSSWSLFGAAPVASSSAASPLTIGRLPVARASDVYLARARLLIATGRVHDGLAELERIPVGDPLHAEAERLRADAQRTLLTVAAADRPGVTDSGASAVRFRE
jgi:tetratricopeptide (TPR) repeat protein